MVWVLAAATGDVAATSDVELVWQCIVGCRWQAHKWVTGPQGVRSPRRCWKGASAVLQGYCGWWHNMLELFEKPVGNQTALNWPGRGWPLASLAVHEGGKPKWGARQSPSEYVATPVSTASLLLQHLRTQSVLNLKPQMAKKCPKTAHSVWLGPFPFGRAFFVANRRLFSGWLSPSARSPRRPPRRRP